MRVVTGTILLLLMLVAIAESGGPEKRDQAGQRAAIAAEDLNTRYVVYGPLGFPLGTVVSVVAEPFENMGKGESDWLRVTSVAGKPLQQPVAMPFHMWPWANVQALMTGTRYELRVYQHGGFSGLPDQVMKETVAVQTHGYAFTTDLVVIKSIRQLSVSPKEAKPIPPEPANPPPPLRQPPATVAAPMPIQPR